MPNSRGNASQRFWEFIEALGGHGVWDSKMVIVSLEGSSVSDEDLRRFADFPHVQILNLSRTSVGDLGLSYLDGLPGLETLLIVETKISDGALELFRENHPDVSVVTTRPPKDAINPFTRKPLDEP